jgi:hypothetical protein
MPNIDKRELSDKIIERVYENAGEFNGNANYPYAAGAFEIIIRYLIQDMPEEILAKYQKQDQ